MQGCAGPDARSSPEFDRGPAARKRIRWRSRTATARCRAVAQQPGRVQLLVYQFLLGYLPILHPGGSGASGERALRKGDNRTGRFEKYIENTPAVRDLPDLRRGPASLDRGRAELSAVFFFAHGAISISSSSGSGSKKPSFSHARHPGWQIAARTTRVDENRTSRSRQITPEVAEAHAAGSPTPGTSRRQPDGDL